MRTPTAKKEIDNLLIHLLQATKTTDQCHRATTARGFQITCRRSNHLSNMAWLLGKQLCPRLPAAPSDLSLMWREFQIKNDELKIDANIEPNIQKHFNIVKLAAATSASVLEI